MKKLIILCFIVLFGNVSFSQSKIFKAIEKGDIQLVTSYISEGKDLNVLYEATSVDEYEQKKISYSFELIEYAAVQDQLAIVKLFVNQKDRLKDFNMSISKAFAASISKGDIVLTKYLLENGADINTICGICYQQTAIHTALEYSYFDIFDLLFEKDAKVDGINSFGRTLLHSVAHTGNVPIAEKLIQKGLDINAQDNDGATPVIYAASNGFFDMFKMLVDKGADLSIKENDGSGVLMSAVEFGNIDIINFLLDRKCDVNIKNNDNDTPLIFAASLKKPDVAKLLISKGADLNIVNSKGESVLLWAIWNGDAELARAIIDKGADLTNMDYLKPAKKYIKDQSFIDYLKAKIKK